ncbi:hypothetical protein FFY45_11955 [Xanthomonas hortorum]|nr:hypothetical protein [Xanthomonas hortorum]
MSRDGGRARALQPNCRSSALQPTHPNGSSSPQGARELELQRRLDVPNRVGRGCDALTARGTRRKYVHVGSVAASMPPHGPASGKGIAPANVIVYGWEPQRRPRSHSAERSSFLANQNKTLTRNCPPNRAPDCRNGCIRRRI